MEGGEEGREGRGDQYPNIHSRELSKDLIIPHQLLISSARNSTISLRPSHCTVGPYLEVEVVGLGGVAGVGGVGLVGVVGPVVVVLHHTHHFHLAALKPSLQISHLG